MTIPNEIQSQVAQNLEKWKKETKIHHWPIADKYTVIRVEDSSAPSKKSGWFSHQEPAYNYYLIDYSNKIGSGGCGKVYAAYKINNSTTQIEDQKSYVAKVTNSTYIEAAAEAIAEVRGANGKIFTEGPTTIEDNHVCLIMERITGKQFDPNDPEFKKSSFSLRVRGLFQLASTLQDNHFAKSTTYAQFHGDIKPANFLIDLDNQKDTINFRLADYGLSTKLTGDPNALRNLGSEFGTKRYMPPEAFDYNYSAKTDVWAFAIIAIYFFGGEAVPLGRKIGSELVLDGLFNEVTMPKFIRDAKPLIKAFIEKVGHIDHEQRANAQLLFPFMTALNQLCSFHEHTPDDKTAQYDQIAKLILISQELWEQSLGTQFIEKYNKKFDQAKGEKETQKTWTAINFAANEKLGEAIVSLHDNNLLDEFSAALLASTNTSTSTNYAVKAINLLNEHKLLTQDNLFELIYLPDKCKWLVEAPSFETGYVFLLSDEARTKHLTSLKPRDQLTILGDLLKNLGKYTEIAGLDKAYEVRSSLTKLLTQDIETYSAHKAKLDPNHYEHTFFGYKNGVKKQAADNLIKVLNGEINAINKQDKTALTELFSDLRKKSKILVDYVEKNPEIFTRPNLSK